MINEMTMKPIEEENASKLKTKPSEASLAQNTSKASFDLDYFSKFE